jgi:hypothetical protein
MVGATTPHEFMIAQENSEGSTPLEAHPPTPSATASKQWLENSVTL